MALTVSKVRDLMELYAGQAGVTKDRINPVLLLELINLKQKEFCRDTGILTSKWTLTSVADQQEYQLPSDCLQVTKCTFDGYLAYPATFDEVERLSGELS